eukprot:3052197-Prymnesium_polylepis.1
MREQRWVIHVANEQAAASVAGGGGGGAAEGRLVIDAQVATQQHHMERLALRRRLKRCFSRQPRGRGRPRVRSRIWRLG